MSRAFVDDDSEGREELPELPQSDNPGYLTPKGLERLEAELARLEEEVRPPLLATIEEGDTGATQAEIELARVEQRVAYLKARIARAIVVDPSEAAPDRVHFGSKVTVRDQNGEEMHIHIVGEDETDIEHGSVSCFSPLAKALMMKQVGDTATWHRPIGDLDLTVLAIEPPEH
jgi:transcription elongation GreA/GreB family factor